MKSPVDIDNPVIQLCLAGARADFVGNLGEAHRLYLQAWANASDEYEACIAAHYVARHQENVQEILHWNQEALARAEAVGDKRVEAFYPSLYLNLGRSYELTGNQKEAQRYYALAAALGFDHRVEV